MICCLPFTYYSRPCLHVLGKLGLPLVLVYPSRRFIAEQLQPDLAQGLLDIRTPAGIDETQLDRVLAEYRAWADLHQRNLDALAGFFNASRQSAPFVDETDPTQIRTQLNRDGQAGPDSAYQRLMQAAVFMAMAHEFDSHQDTLSKDLAAIGKVERQMFQGLAGDAAELRPFLTADRGSPEERLVDPGLYLTDKRIQAWAILTSTAAVDSLIYLTTSKAVFDSLCDVFPCAVPLVEWNLGPLAPQGGAPLLGEPQRTYLKELTQAKRFADVATLPAGQPADRNLWPRLVINGLEACAPRDVLSRLAGFIKTPEDNSPARKDVNTLIGYLEVIGG